MRKFLLVAAALPFLAGFIPAEKLLPTYVLFQYDGSVMKWGDSNMGTGATVSYAYLDQSTLYPTTRNCKMVAPLDGLMTEYRIDRATYEAETERAFQAWSAVANITFHEVEDPTNADIVLGVMDDVEGNPPLAAAANVLSVPSEVGGTRTIITSIVCLNPLKSWKIGFDGNLDSYDLFHVMTHEIGHAIGIDHPGFNRDMLMSFSYEEKVQGLQAGDIAGAVELYGSPNLVTGGLQ